MSEIREDSFIFYRSFYDAMEGVSDKDRLALYDAIVGLALNGELVNLPKSVKGLFILIKPQIEANIRKRIAGRKGGRPPYKVTNGHENEITIGYENIKPNVNGECESQIDTANGECEGLMDKGCGEKEEGTNSADDSPQGTFEAAWYRYEEMRDNMGKPVSSEEVAGIMNEISNLGDYDRAVTILNEATRDKRVKLFPLSNKEPQAVAGRIAAGFAL